MDAALPALASREVPVMRRFFSWLYGGSDFEPTFFEQHSKPFLVHGLQVRVLCFVFVCLFPCVLCCFLVFVKFSCSLFMFPFVRVHALAACSTSHPR